MRLVKNGDGMQKQNKIEAIKYSKELLLRAHTYCGVLEDMILSLDNRPFDEDYMNIHWSESISHFIYKHYIELETLYDKEIIEHDT